VSLDIPKSWHPRDRKEDGHSLFLATDENGKAGVQMLTIQNEVPIESREEMDRQVRGWFSIARSNGSRSATIQRKKMENGSLYFCADAIKPSEAHSPWCWRWTGLYASPKWWLWITVDCSKTDSIVISQAIETCEAFDKDMQ